MLVFASSPDMVREIKNLLPNFKQIVWRCFTLLNILVRMGRTILLIKPKQFHQKFYSNNLYILYISRMMPRLINKPETSLDNLVLFW